VIPEQMNAITIKQGEDVQVRWTSNLTGKNAEAGGSTVFDVDVSMADYRGGSLRKGDSVYRSTVTSTQENPVSGCTIPAAYVGNISAMGRYSFISSRSPHPIPMMLPRP
jgi:hypothetical protein